MAHDQFDWSGKGGVIKRAKMKQVSRYAYGTGVPEKRDVGVPASETRRCGAAFHPVNCN